MADDMPGQYSESLRNMKNTETYEEAADELDLGRYLNVFRRWWRLILLCGALGALAAFGTSSLLAKSYDAEASLAIIRTGTVLNFDPKIRTVSDTDPTQNLDQVSLRKSLLTLATSNELAQQVVDRIGDRLPARLRDPALLVAEMSVTNDADLIRIRANAETSEQAALLANTWAQVYQERVNAIYNESLVTPETARAQAEAAKQTYDARQAELIAFLKDNSLEELKRRRDVVAAQLDNQSKEESKLIQLEAEAKALRERIASGAASGSRGAGLATLLLEASAFSTGAELPVNVQLALNQIDAGGTFDDQLKQLDSLIAALQSRRQALHDDTQQTLHQELNSLKAQVEQTDAKERELTAARDLAWSTYQTLSTQVAQTDVAAQSQGQVVRLASAAIVPLEPASSRRLTSTLLGGIVGLLIGAALAFVMEFLGSGLTDADRVSQNLKLPTLAVLPQPPATAALPELPAEIAEPLRGLRYYLFSKPGLGVVTTTSATPGEGASALATQLAILSAHSGHKILLVDANLRAPAQHTAFRLERAEGLSDLLRRGPTADPARWSAYARPSGIEGLTVVTAGAPVEDPAALLESKSFQDLIASLRESFDLVIVDAPAVLGVIDAAIIAHATDGALLVLDSVNATAKDAQRAREQLAPYTTLLGVVLMQAASAARPEIAFQTPKTAGAAPWAGLRTWFVRLLGPRTG